MSKIKRFFKKHSWILILLVATIFIPQSFNYQAKLNMRVLVTGLGIDKTETGYEVTAQVIMPSPGSESGGSGARLDFISEQGASVSEGIQKIAYKIGKTAGLSHAGFVIVGESMLEDNLASALDYFARDAKVNPSLMLLVCSGLAKDTLKQTGKLELSVGVDLQKVFIYKQASLNGLVMPIEEFLNASFGISKSSTVSGIVIAPEGEESLSSDSSSEQSGSSLEGQTAGEGSGTSEGNEESSSSQSEASQSSSQNGSSASFSGQSEGSSRSANQNGGSSSSSSEEKNARIKFYNDIYYFKDGEYINKFSEEKEILGTYFADEIATSGNFKLDGVTGGILEEATIGISFTNKTTFTSIKFEHGRPTFTFNIKIKDVQVTEILNKDEPTINLYNHQDQEMLKLIKDEIKNEIGNCIVSAFDKAKNDNVDIFDIGEKAYQTKTKAWKQLYAEYGENYLKNVSLKVNVEITNIN